MGVTKISVSVDDEALAMARLAAENAGMSLSAWLSRAAADAARIEAGLRGVAEFEAEYGAFTAEELDRADRTLDELGMGRLR